jgi:diadenosine tetraphosphate (Ap4A) HIT family hydrolase
MNDLSDNAPALGIDLPGFGSIDQARLISGDDLFIVLDDKYPISPGHALIVARRAARRFGELTPAEKARLGYWIDWCISHLQESLTPPPDGFNVGLNDGLAAGQTIPQFHVHVIPRYEGDVTDPRGGVRFVIPENAKYW